jgi:hypothetical protein
MSNYLDDDISSPPEASNRGVIRVERVWQHRHDLELRTAKPRPNRAALLMLGAGSLILGVTYVFAYPDMIPMHNLVSREVMASFPVGQENVAASTKLRDIVDTTPATVSVIETQVASLPVAVVPTRRPVFEPVKSNGPKKINGTVSPASSSDVLRYDRCNPGCKTRDPLVVRTISATVSPLPTKISVETAEVDDTNRAVEIGASALNGAGHVLVQTVALPFTTLRLGRDAVIKIAGLD